MSPIRIGLVGLSVNSQSTSWASRSHLPFLQSSVGKQHFEIVALCNTSVASGEKSKDHYKLPSSVKTYDSPAKLAEDPDVDLVVNVTGVEQHYPILRPVVKAGKNVYTELPLASSVEQMKELVATAKEKGIKTVFGMQGQTSSVSVLLRKIIEEGTIGKVLSSTWTGAAQFAGGEGPLPKGHRAFADRKAGANIMTVNFLHTFNHIQSVLGEIDTYQSILGNQRPVATIIDPAQDGKEIEKINKDVPDQVMMQGRLKSGALLSYHLRGGANFAGAEGVIWSIYGEKGEIRITNPASPIDISHDGIKIQLHLFGEKEPKTLELPENEMEKLSDPARSVGMIYLAYYNGNQGGMAGYPDWETGFKVHEVVEDMFSRSANFEEFGQPVKSL